MNQGRLGIGQAVAGVSAILLFVFMFFDWFGVEARQSSRLSLFVPFGGGNAWQMLDVIPIFLVLAIVIVVGAALVRLAGADWKPTVPVNAAVTMLGGLAALLILSRIVFPAGRSESFEGITVEPTLEAGIFLALVAAFGIALGGYRAMREEGVSFAGLRAHLDKG